MNENKQLDTPGRSDRTERGIPQTKRQIKAAGQGLVLEKQNLRDCCVAAYFPVFNEDQGE